MKITIGMRYIKTAIAVTVCIFVSGMLNSEYPFFAAIAAVISMENTIANSFTVGKNRIMGTLVGAIVGFGFVMIMPNNAILSGLGVVLIIYICNAMGWKNSISIASIVFLAIMINLNGQSPLLYTMNRLLDTVLGISIALMVNVLIFPYDNTKQLTQGLDQLKNQALEVLEKQLSGESIEESNAVFEAIEDLKSQHQLYVGEFRLKKSKELNESLELALGLFEGFYRHQKMLEELTAIHGLHPKDQESIIYNYHLGCARQALAEVELIVLKNNVLGNK